MTQYACWPQRPWGSRLSVCLWLRNQFETEGTDASTSDASTILLRAPEAHLAIHPKVSTGPLSLMR